MGQDRNYPLFRILKLLFLDVCYLLGQCHECLPRFCYVVCHLLNLQNNCGMAPQAREVKIYEKPHSFVEDVGCLSLRFFFIYMARARSTWKNYNRVFPINIQSNEKTCALHFIVSLCGMTDYFPEENSSGSFYFCPE